MVLTKIQTKKPLKFHRRLDFNNFEKKKEKVTIDFYNIFTIGIIIIVFHVNMISDLDCTIILYIYKPYLFSKVNIEDSSFEVFFVNPQIIYILQYQFAQLKTLSHFFLKIKDN